jgi:hypothetical protein
MRGHDRRPGQTREPAALPLREALRGVLDLTSRGALATPSPGRAGPGPGSRRDREKVHLYLDVSGSVESLLGGLFAAVRGVADLVAGPVHLFATDLVDVPVRGLATGLCQSTGGTSLAPVARHIREHRVRRAVIVTDGQAGCVGARDRETLRETILGVALTSGRERDGTLAGLARYVVVLPGLERRYRPGGGERAGSGAGGLDGGPTEGAHVVRSGRKERRGK